MFQGSYPSMFARLNMASIPRLADEIIDEYTNWLHEFNEFEDTAHSQTNKIINMLNKFSRERRHHVLARMEAVSEKTSVLAVAINRCDIRFTEYLLKKCGHVMKEHNVNLPECQLWDNLTFYTQRSNIDPSRYVPQFKLIAPVLWHACRSTEFCFVKLLCESGADVDSTTEPQFNSTPLMCACARNRPVIVKYLVEERRANIHLKDKNGENCLFYAVRYNPQAGELIKYLMDQGVDTNLPNDKGETVLNMSIEHASNKIMNQLINHNQKVGRPQYSQISVEKALIKASELGQHQKFRTLFDYGNVSPQIRVDSLEMIGLSFAHHRDNSAYLAMYWDLSLDERARADIPKNTQCVRKHPNFLPEFTQLADIDRAVHDPLELEMQMLYVRDRMLEKFGNANWTLANVTLQEMHRNSIEETGAFSNLDNFVKINQVWLYTLGLQVSYSKPSVTVTLESIYHFIQYLKATPTQVALESHSTFSSSLVKLFKICMREIRRSLPFVDKSAFINKDLATYLNSLCEIDNAEIFEMQIRAPPTRDNAQMHEMESEYLHQNLEHTVKLTAHLLSFLVYNLKKKCKFTQSQQAEIRRMVKIFNVLCMNFSDASNLRLLSMATRSNLLQSSKFTHKNDFYQDFKTEVNQEFIIYLLEDIGVDPNLIIGNGLSRKTFLNFILFNEKFFCEQSCVDQYIKIFLSRGGHFDFANDENRTLQMIYAKKFGKQLPMSCSVSKHLSLKCLTARVLQSSRLKFWEADLPNDMVEFIARH